MDASIIKAYFAKITTLLQFFSLPDYLILISIFLVILIFFLLSVVFRLSRVIAFFLLLISVILFFSAPITYQYIMENYIKKIDFNLSKNEKLQYDSFYYVEGNITNISHVDFKGCLISTNFIPSNTKKYRYIKYRLLPTYIHYEHLKTPLEKNQTTEFKVVIPSPNPQVQYILESKGMCY